MEGNDPVTAPPHSTERVYRRSARPHSGFRQNSIPFLWGAVILLLIFNLVLLFALNTARLKMVEALAKVETMLDSLAQEVIVYNFEIDQAVPMKADVPFRRSMDIPVNTVIPIDQELTVPFTTPAGEVTLDVPVKTDFPINTVIPVDFDETITVDSVVQLNTTLPVEIDLARTSLAPYLAQARVDVAQLKNRLAFRNDPLPPLNLPVKPADTETTTNTGPSANHLVQEQSQQTAPRPPADEEDTAPPASPAEAPPAIAAEANQDSAPLNCYHPYWPLQPGTTWTYNSSNTSYTQRVEGVTPDQVILNSQYEGHVVQATLGCKDQVVGLNFLGDMRRLSEFGDLSFSNPRGAFLLNPETPWQVGHAWRQESDITGTIEGRQGDTPVIGEIRRGLIRATYTLKNEEPLETPLGSRETMHIEQVLEIELAIDFDLGGRIIPATETVSLTNSYWLAENIGLVQMHWQGGKLKQAYTLDQTPIETETSIPALNKDHLVFVCLMLERQSFDCKGTPQAQLTTPPMMELEIVRFQFPETVGSGTNSVGENTATSETPTKTSQPDVADTPQSLPTPPVIPKPPTGNGGDSELLAYAAAVAAIGDQISAAGQSFSHSALAYRDGQLSLEEFRTEFERFIPQVRGPIEQLNKLGPPAEAAAIHQAMVGGLAKCDQAIDLMGQWLTNFDDNTKLTASLLVAQCIDEVSTAGDELATLVSQSE